ncbi:HNH endonuclease [Mesobacillus maritimus]|uniref:HNH endonuclease n=1 Tax=Mesobacillus maritimus TaxID=1643336 RepID=UPI002040BF97|nr:HNH endonuclease [Mesobacillus maritimus]MCM3585906.1 HNH endonuclease [Mesobacillus maritimus]
MEGIIIGFFHVIGKGIGTVAGVVLGGGVRFVGKKLHSPGVEEFGAGITEGTKQAMERVGKKINQADHDSVDVFSKKELKSESGVDPLKASALEILDNTGNSLTYQVKTSGVMYEGKPAGLKNGKVNAGFMFSVGSVDFKNTHKEQDKSKENVKADTKVPFVEKTIELPIGEVTGTFPVFDVGYEIQLPESLYLYSDDVHFAYANIELHQALETNSDLVHELNLDQQDIERLKVGNTPDGYAWHHHEEPGKLQLVDRDYHQHTGHTGGRELWGGGFEKRY